MQFENKKWYLLKKIPESFFSGLISRVHIIGDKLCEILLTSWLRSIHTGQRIRNKWTTLTFSQVCLGKAELTYQISVQLLLFRGRGWDCPEFLDHPLPGGLDELVHVALDIPRGLDRPQNSVRGERIQSMLKLPASLWGQVIISWNKP